jgi:hypothetical protein
MDQRDRARWQAEVAAPEWEAEAVVVVVVLAPAASAAAATTQAAQDLAAMAGIAPITAHMAMEE